MPVVVPLDIPPILPEVTSLRSAALEWERVAGSAIAAVDNASPALAASRRGALDIRGEAAGVRANRSKTITGVNRARPNHEANLARNAKQNSGGAGQKISRAEGSADNPSANVPNFNPDKPAKELFPAEREMRKRREAVNRERDVGDDIQRRIDRIERDRRRDN